MITISQKDEKVLRQIAKEIPLSDISSKKIKDVLSRMSQALQEQGDGVAIAAPQIGESLRIFVIAGKIFDEKFIRGNAGKSSKGGSGLGLYLGKRIIELHHGSIAVTSPGLGKGSTFSVLLPKL